jgi:hypothetical protein
MAMRVSLSVSLVAERNALSLFCFGFLVYQIEEDDDDDDDR